jgi:D-sedoheptulose 7-phosphate isomerase
MSSDAELDLLVRERIRSSLSVQRALLEDPDLVHSISEVAGVVVRALGNGHKLLLFGNGGSAADAQHIAAELVGRYLSERRALPAIALTVDTSVLTAVANDLSFDHVFARQIEALGAPQDVALAISTSGNSPNVLLGIASARRRGLTTVGLTGRTGGKLRGAVEHCIAVPTDETPRIQESHILIGHILCEIVERGLAC